MNMVTIDTYVGKLLRAVAISCLVGLFSLLFINVVARTFQLAGFAWFDEIVQGLFAWMVFTGAAALWRENDHFAVNWLDIKLGGTAWLKPLRVLIALLCICFLLAMTKYGYDLFSKSRALTPILQLPTHIYYAVIPISGVVMTAYSIRNLITAITHSLTKKGNNDHDL